MAQAPIIPGALPLGYCYPSSAQQLLNDVAAISYVEVPDNVSGMFFGPDTPPNQSLPWFNTTFGRFYYYLANPVGMWVSKYLPEPSAFLRWEWEGEPADLLAWDNPGSVPIPGDASAQWVGPFWEIDHNYDGRSSMGPGAIDLAEPATNLALSQNLGEGAHLQDREEVGPHTHLTNTNAKLSRSGGGGREGFAYAQAGFGSGTAADPPDLAILDNAYAVDQLRMPVIHPVRGIYKIKRTARIWFTLAP